MLTIPTFIIDSVIAVLDIEDKAKDDLLQKIDDSKSILKRCEFTENEKNRIYEILFEAERELKLNDDLDKAKELFAIIQPKLVECDPQTSIELGYEK